MKIGILLIIIWLSIFILNYIFAMYGGIINMVATCAMVINALYVDWEVIKNLKI